MKELTIEQKAKRYDKAIERARKLYNSEETSVEVEIACENIFPELYESEDERIRKSIHIYLDWLDGRKDYTPKGEYSIKDMIAWLEKQSQTFTKKDVDDAYLKGVTNTKNEIEKQYEATYQIRKDIATFIFNYRGDIKDRSKWMNYLGINVSFVEKQGEQPKGKSALEAAKEERVDNQNRVKPKVEPKFKVGDWITNGDYTWKIIEVKPLDYMLQAQDGNIVNDTISHVDINFHLWTIEDAKDGDVLISRNNNPFIYNGRCDYFTLGAYCGLIGYSFFIDNEKCNWTVNEDIRPATKEQREILLNEMADAGYEFDFDMSLVLKRKS